MKRDEPLRILIVDDFEPDRDELVRLAKQLPMVEVIGHVADGKSALRALEAARPDLVITDIQMPGISGIELARRIRTEFPRTAVVFATRHEQFEYARKALYLGSYGYLVKPADAREMAMVLQAVRDGRSEGQEIAQSWRSMLLRDRPYFSQHFLRMILTGQETHEIDRQTAEILGIQQLWDDCTLLLVEIDDYRSVARATRLAELNLFRERILEQIRQTIAGNDQNRALFTEPSRVAVVVAGAGENVEATAMEITESFRETDVSVSVAVTARSTGPADLRRAYAEGVRVLERKFSLGQGSVVRSEDALRDAPVVAEPLPAAADEVPEVLLHEQSGPLDRWLWEFEQRSLGLARESVLRDTYVVLVETDRILREHQVKVGPLENATEMWSTPSQIDTAVGLVAWLRDVLLGARAALKESERSRLAVIADELKQKIEENFAHNVTIDYLASEMGFSSGYLNGVFRKATGQTIFEYAHAFRMDQARLLLTTTNLKMFEVAQQLGYSHTSYFNEVFKKNFGMLPSQFRARHYAGAEGEE